MALVSGWSDLPFLRIPKEDPVYESAKTPGNREALAIGAPQRIEE